MIIQKIKNLIEESVRELQAEKKLPDFEIPEILVEHPEQEEHGDYATNIGFEIAEKGDKNPEEIAGIIASEIESQKPKVIAQIEVVNGFINFFLSKDYLQSKVKEILENKESFANLKLGKGKKIQVEFISANPTGPLTVGNARGGPFGDTLANVLEKAGFEVERAYYINDYGMQILTLGHSVLKDKEAKYRGPYIDYLSKKIKEPPRAPSGPRGKKDLYPERSLENDSFRAYPAGEKAAQIIIKEMIKETTAKMKIDYDEWISESWLHESGRVDRALNFLKKKDLIYEKEGALWFKSSKFGDERDRVVVKSDGWKTYLAGDIALHQYKFKEKGFDKVIDIWGADHAGDVPGLKGAIEALGFKGKLDIILLQFVTVLEKGKRIKMSKRKGTYVTMNELLNKVGSDVVRFFFLQKAANTHLNFDLSLAKKQSKKNPVYYVQYAHARICSIFKRIKNQESRAKNLNLQLLDHQSELNLIKQLIKFPEVIKDTAQDYQVHRLTRYASDLATAFHQFYRDCKVLTDQENLRKARLGLILATKIVLKETLNLMGISAPEEM